MEKEEISTRFKAWCAEFKKAEKEEMSLELTEIYLRLLLMERRNIPVAPPEKTSIDFIDSRIKWQKLKITEIAKMFILCLCVNFADTVMYLSYLSTITPSEGEVITLKDITFAFPQGFLTREALIKMWKLQKLENGDLLNIKFT